MKRTFIILVLLTVFGAASANAQEDKQLFNHMAAGVTLGVDGLGLQVAVPVTPLLQVRAGYAFNIPGTGYASFGTHTMDNGHTVTIEEMPVRTSSYPGGLGQIFVDFFPGKAEVFRISAGFFAGGGKFLTAKADMRESMLPEDYGVLMSKGAFKFSTDADGYGYGDALSWKVLPYLGVGTGRMRGSENKRFTFSFDAGVAFAGGMKIQTYDFSTGSKVACPVTSEATIDEDGKMQDGGFIDALSGLAVLPVIKFGFFYQIF